MLATRNMNSNNFTKHFLCQNGDFDFILFELLRRNIQLGPNSVLEMYPSANVIHPRDGGYDSGPTQDLE